MHTHIIAYKRVVVWRPVPPRGGDAMDLIIALLALLCRAVTATMSVLTYMRKHNRDQ